jgi:CO/xanthine dehydrogenase FAD-binding subunit
VTRTLFSYRRPRAVDDALEALATAPLTVLAGGTDYYPARVGEPCDEDILDITALDELRGIEEQDDHWRIGALTSWSTLARASLPPWFAGLKLAAREVGGEQIQNAGTIGGNLCNASPAADGVPPLLALDAAVELASLDRREQLPLGEFIRGNRRTARRPDQLLTAVLVPKPKAPRAAGHFVKLGARRYLVISLAMVGASLEVGADGRIEAARLAVGACSPVAMRLPAAERALAGASCDHHLAALLQPEHVSGLAPIDDVRASAAYRSDVALTLVRRAVSELVAIL